MEQQQDSRDDREQLAEVIERRAKDIIERWLGQVRADAKAARVPVTDLQNGIGDYLDRLVHLLRGSKSLPGAGLSAWTDVAQEHALTRVRLGFDVVQLLHELLVLRRVTLDILREENLLDADVMDKLLQLIDEATTSSLKSYIDFHEFTARRMEAEHIGFLTHELKNPLGAVVMAMEQLRSEELSPTQRRLCQICDRNIDRIRHMIDEVLLTERLQVGEMETEPVDLTLGELIGDAVDVFKQAAKDKRIELKTTYDPGLSLRADPKLTLSAAENLLDNAIKYTDNGEVTLQVEEQGNDVVFHVRDRCSGLSPEELRVIFEPFKRAHARKPGTGLGLAIARRAIEAQGGTIHAESSAAEGCHFWFRLPRTHH